MIQVNISNWQHFRDWCCEMISSPTFDDDSLHDDDRAVLKSTSRWPREPSQTQLRYLGSIASRVVSGLDDDCWTRDDLVREVNRRTSRTEFRRQREERLNKSIGQTNYLGKFNFLRADIRRYKLSAGDIAVLATIYDRTWSSRDEARISLSEFVDETGLNKASVCRSIIKLAGLGLFEIERSSGGGSKKSIYRGVLRLATQRYSKIEDDLDDDADGDSGCDSERDSTVASDDEVDEELSQPRDRLLYPSSRTHRSRPSASERAAARHRIKSPVVSLEGSRDRDREDSGPRSRSSVGPDAYERALARHRKSDAEHQRAESRVDARPLGYNPYWREDEEERRRWMLALGGEDRPQREHHPRLGLARSN
ncbi:MAG: hypothetical protein KGO96_10315 [Elusimicrobia bacterium]|nr:hypothetical protein [Elusimicrobiota bacterium]